MWKFVSVNKARLALFLGTNFHINLRKSVGGNGLGGTLARAGLDLLDAWSDGDATPHDRLSPLGEALAVSP